jgi:hypothetical protein
VKRLAALAAWHDEWVADRLDSAEFHPAGRKKGSDYNLHYVDLESDDDEFHAKAREILGLT